MPPDCRDASSILIQNAREEQEKESNGQACLKNAQATKRE